MTTGIEHDRLVEDNLSPAGHRYNDDLLINEGDLNRAQRGFPRVAHVLRHPTLQDAFRRFDLPANAAKKRGRRAGLLAIGMGTISLVIAAAMPVFGDALQMWVSMFAAAFGVVSIAIGFGGVLVAGSKRRWLCNRLMTERLRQFHFQSFVCRWQEISDSMKDKSAVEKYEHQRDSWFTSAFVTLPAHLGSELTEILEDESDHKCWLHPLPSLPGDEIAQQLEQLLEAYRELRIQHQLHYANHQLRSGQDIFSWSPRLQSAIFFISR